MCEKRIGSHLVQRFEYDAEQRLVCVEQARYEETERIVFGYDPLGRPSMTTKGSTKIATVNSRFHSKAATGYQVTTSTYWRVNPVAHKGKQLTSLQEEAAGADVSTRY